MAALAAAAGVLEPLRDFESGMSLGSFLQTHYKRLSPEKLGEILKRIEQEIAKNYGVKATVQAQMPLDGVQFGYALSLSRCTGVRNCVTACMKENNQSRDPEMQYIRVIEMENGSFDLEKGDHYYDPETVTAGGQVLHARAVPAMRQPALRQGMSRRGDLAGAGRDHGDRLRLVHRLPVLHGRVPLRRAPLQLQRPKYYQGRNQPQHGIPQ